MLDTLLTNRFPRITFVALTLAFLAAVATPRCAAQYAGKPGIEVASIDAQTRWAFRSLSPVTVSSPIVRFGDVAVPLDPNMAGWQRLSRAPVGLVPLNGKPMTIEVPRLAQVIHAAEATPPAIDWIGPSKIVVHYRPGTKPKTNAPATRAVQAGTRQPGQVMRASHIERATETLPRLSPVEARRVIQWIDRALDSFMPEVSRDYGVDIDPAQAVLARFSTMSVVTSLEPLEQLHEGDVPFHLAARGVSGPVEATVIFHLAAHPRVVMPVKSLKRGDRIAASDLVVEAISRDKMDAEYVVDPQEIIGLEVRTSVRADRPIKRSSLGPPIVVHRGDLLEVQVIGGGVVVTTNAKAMEDGAASDLIQIETLDPRKRLVARVVRPGLVEIVTRSPNVTR